MEHGGLRPGSLSEMGDAEVGWGGQILQSLTGRGCVFTGSWVELCPHRR